MGVSFQLLNFYSYEIKNRDMEMNVTWKTQLDIYLNVRLPGIPSDLCMRKILIFMPLRCSEVIAYLSTAF